MRCLAVLLQILIPGTIGAYLALMMGMGMSEGPDRTGMFAVIVAGGAVIGLLVWLLGLIADRAFLIRVALTVALSVLGFVVSYLLIEATLRARESPQLGLLLFYAELAAPVVGAIAGYYWPWRKPRVEAR